VKKCFSFNTSKICTYARSRKLLYRTTILQTMCLHFLYVVLYLVMFCRSFLSFSFGYCIAYSSIFAFWLPFNIFIWIQITMTDIDPALPTDRTAYCTFTMVLYIFCAKNYIFVGGKAEYCDNILFSTLDDFTPHNVYLPQHNTNCRSFWAVDSL
jgi:hypothetical protein